MLVFLKVILLAKAAAAAVVRGAPEYANNAYDYVSASENQWIFHYPYKRLRLKLNILLRLLLVEAVSTIKALQHTSTTDI